MEILQIKNLTFSYPETKMNALKNINIDIKEGDFCVLFGETGCGKSTLLKLIKKEIAPYGNMQGEILFCNKNINDWDKKLTSQIGFVMQNPDSQIVTDTVWHELCFGLQNIGLSQDIMKRRIAEISGYFGLQKLFHKKTYELSGGEKQLLNLASIMAMQPKILLLDEPTSQLDPITASEYINTLRKLNSELGLTVIIAEHRLEEILPICTKALLMDKGKVLFDDSPKKISEFYNKNKSHSSFLSMPSSVRIFSGLNGEGKTPLTVRECKEYIHSNFENEIKYIKHENKKFSDEKIVEVKNISFRYDRESEDVLSDTTFSVYKGEHFCILGGNGTGKTTLINNISGVLKPYKGKIFIDNKEIKKYKGNTLYKNNISLLPQNPEVLFTKDSVKDELYETAELLEYKKEKAESIISYIAKNLDIKDLFNMHPYDLSGGEQQKVALAKVLLNNPKILILDEPTKGIDAKSKKNLSNILVKLKEKDVTIITVTHDAEFAAEYSDRCGMFFDGQIVSSSVPSEFFSENNFYTTAANRISRDFFENAIICEDVINLCQLNKGKNNE